MYYVFSMANGCLFGAGQNGAHTKSDGQWPKGTNSSNVQLLELLGHVVFSYATPLSKNSTVKSC